MESIVKIQIDQWAQDKAEEYFIRICGEMPEDQESFVSRMRVGANLNCKAIFREFDYTPLTKGQREVVSDTVVAGDELFCGGIFRYFNSQKVKKLLTYLLTIGPLPSKGTNGMLESFYVDAWGSAYVEAAHDVFKKRLQRIYGGDLYVSEPFGPGYYGIDLSQTERLFRLLHAEEVGLTLMDSGMMVPEKSCSGFYVISETPLGLPEDCCDHCLSPHNCQFCKKG